MYLSLRDTDRAGSRDDRSGRRTRVAPVVIALGMVSLLTDVSSEMVAAVLPLYLTTQVGLGYLAYGFVDGLYQGVSAVVRIAGGYAGDRGGRPKWVARLRVRHLRAEPDRPAAGHRFRRDRRGDHR